jgi:hypothetical protein
MWEHGWQPPIKLTERCVPGVECHVDHKVEWDYAKQLVKARATAQKKPRTRKPQKKRRP